MFKFQTFPFSIKKETFLLNEKWLIETRTGSPPRDFPWDLPGDRDLHPWIVSIACSKHFRGAWRRGRTIVYHGKVGRLHKTWKRFPVTILSVAGRSIDRGLRGYGEDTARATESFLFHAQFSRRGKREAARYNPRELEHETKAFAYFEILARKRALFYLISRESIIRVLIAKLSPKQEDNFCIIVARTTARSFEGLNCEYRCSRRIRRKMHRFESSKRFKINRFWNYHYLYRGSNVNKYDRKFDPFVFLCFFVARKYFYYCHFFRKVYSNRNVFMRLTLRAKRFFFF